VINTSTQSSTYTVINTSTHQHTTFGSSGAKQTNTFVDFEPFRDENVLKNLNLSNWMVKNPPPPHPKKLKAKFVCSGCSFQLIFGVVTSKAILRMYELTISADGKSF
jgi:hypothetical protein